MKKKKLTLRVKLTLFTSALFLSVCLLQAVISIYSSGILASAVTTPQMTLEPSLHMEDGGMAMTVPVEIAQLSFNRVAMVSMLLLAIIGYISIYILVKRELKPLEALSRQVADLDVGNPFLPSHMPVGGDEIQQVTAAIDDMTVRVNEAYQMQKNFSANVAHELRTPLAVLQTKLEVFRLKEERSLIEYEVLHTVLSQNVFRLSALVDELSLLTNQNEVNMTTPVSLSDLAREAAMELETLAAKRNISIDVIGDAVLTGNDCLLQRLIFNLMQNAVKYNVENGTVQVDLKDSTEEIQLVISDTGVGIPADSKAHIFDPFYRVDQSRSRDIGGSGLGLALVKRIVTQHGGQISVNDNFPEGSVFRIIFPQNIHK